VERHTLTEPSLRHNALPRPTPVARSLRPPRLHSWPAPGHAELCGQPSCRRAPRRV